MAVAKANRRSASVGLETLRPLGTKRLADEIVDQMRDLILQEGLSEGSRLPSERDLARRFGSSRAVVAQALRTLSLIGLVEIRRGSGAYVVRKPATVVAASVNLMLDFQQGSLEHLCQLRLWLETLGALQACAAVDDARLRMLNTALDRLADSAESTSSWIAADTNFHALVVAGAGNPYLTALYENVHTAVLTIEYEQWIRTDDVPEWLASDGADRHLEVHAPIVRAIESKSEPAIRDALHEHHLALLNHLAQIREQMPERTRRAQGEKSGY